MTKLGSDYLNSTKKLFEYYYTIGRKAIQQLSDEEIHFSYDPEDNNIATIAKHMIGNMHSRFTNFLVEDGEKAWRNREDEFVDTIHYKAELLEAWDSGWQIVFQAIEDSKEVDMNEQLIYIRNQGHTIIEAFSRQLAHYASHTGQIIYLAKSIKGSEWITLSIAKGKSANYNEQKFNQVKSRGFFADEFIDQEE